MLTTNTSTTSFHSLAFFSAVTRWLKHPFSPLKYLGIISTRASFSNSENGLAFVLTGFAMAATGVLWEKHVSNILNNADWAHFLNYLSLTIHFIIIHSLGHQSNMKFMLHLNYNEKNLVQYVEIFQILPVWHQIGNGPLFWINPESVPWDTNTHMKER